MHSICTSILAIVMTLGVNGTDVDCLNSGPDLIIGDIFDAESYGSVGDRAAFSIGTDICNIGDEPVNWIAETPDHPVFDRSLYRVHDNRIQQIALNPIMSLSTVVPIKS